MASMNNEENKNKGAAEEPEPEPDDASSTPGAASYDPTIYQRPHPDDRGGGGGKKGAAATKARGKTEDKSKDKGAAEEPEPEPQDGSLSSSAAPSYDPTVFQRPHPDDRGGADGCKPRKDGGEPGDGKPRTKDGKGALSLDRCGNCGVEGDLRKCKQCGAVAYCGEACQKASECGRATDTGTMQRARR